MTAVEQRYQDDAVIRRLVSTAKTIAIVGLSPNRLRGSFFVGFYLQRHGYRIIPVNPKESEILGERCYPSLSEIPEPVDIVDVFRRPDAVPDIAREAVEIGAKALWLQYGVISPEGATIASDAGLDVVMDRCFKIEHSRHGGQLHTLGLSSRRISSKRPKKPR